MGHPHASSALLKASTQPHFWQRSNLVPPLSKCGQVRQISRRRAFSFLLTRLTPFLMIWPAASSKLLAMVAMLGRSLELKPGFCAVRLKTSFCGRVLDSVVILPAATHAPLVHGLNVVVDGDGARGQGIRIADGGVAAADL